MNYGIIQNRRHDKKGAGAAGGASSLLQDTRLREMAKQMGLDAKDFGHESAQNLWQLLDDMAANDPGAYQKFIQEQLKDGPPMASPSSSSQAGEDADEMGSSNSNQATHNATKATKHEKSPVVLLPRYFTPYPGFVVKCTMFYTVKCQQKETKLFLNCCAHEMVDMPKNPNSGKDVPEDTRAAPSTSNLSIPLAVGKLREVADVAGDVCVACDVVFHPWVMRRCEWDANFKREVMKLAIQWVQQDVQVRFVHQVGKFIKSRYKGGSVAANGTDIVTAKFLVDPSAASSSGKGSDNQRSESTKDQKEGRAGKRDASSVIESPSELLKQIHLNRNESATSESLEREFLIKPADEKSKKTSSASIDILSTPLAASSSQAVRPKSEANKNKLIEEQDPASPSPFSSKPLDATTKKQQQQPAKVKGAAAVVKKGFLLSANAKKKAPLYLTGSSEGHAPSPYVNLLSRSKVVDLSDVERQKQQQEEEKRKLKDEFSFFSTPSRGGTPVSSSSGSAAEVDCGDFEFEQLCMDADPELKPQQQHAEGVGSESDPARQLFGEGFEEISKFLAM